MVASLSCSDTIFQEYVMRHTFPLQIVPQCPSICADNRGQDEGCALVWRSYDWALFSVV